MKLSAVELAWREFRAAMPETAPPELLTSNARVNTEGRDKPFRSRGYFRTHRSVKPGADKPSKSRDEVARPGEVQFKAWSRREAERLGVNVGTISYRVKVGKYKGLKVRRVNDRVVFVCGDLNCGPASPEGGCRPLPGEVAFSEWAELEAERSGLSMQGVYMKFSRGGFPGLKVRKVHDRLRFVLVNGG